MNEYDAMKYARTTDYVREWNWRLHRYVFCVVLLLFLFRIFRFRSKLCVSCFSLFLLLLLAFFSLSPLLNFFYRFVRISVSVSRAYNAFDAMRLEPTAVFCAVVAPS